MRHNHEAQARLFPKTFLGSIPGIRNNWTLPAQILQPAQTHPAELWLHVHQSAETGQIYVRRGANYLRTCCSSVQSRISLAHSRAARLEEIELPSSKHRTLER